MRKRILTNKVGAALGVLILMMIAWSSFASAAAFPRFDNYVNDYVGVMDSNTKSQLNTLLSELDRRTTSQVAVAVIDTTAPDVIETYAVKLFEKWGVGNAKDDNGVLIVVAMQERKIRIEVGYGLEGAIPDSVAASIIANSMTPQFRAGNPGEGIRAGVESIVMKVLEEYGMTPEDLVQGYQSSRHAGSSSYGRSRPKTLLQKIFSFIFMIAMIILFIRNPRLFLLMLLFSGRGGGGSWSRGGGGGFGGGFGGFGGGMSGGGGASGGW